MSLFTSIDREYKSQKELLHTRATGDSLFEITPPCVIYNSGKPIAIFGNHNYTEVPGYLDIISREARSTKRINTLSQKSAVFGYNCRIPVRNIPCSKTTLSLKYPKITFDLFSIADKIFESLDTIFTTEVSMQESWIDQNIKKDYFVSRYFTQAILNKNNELFYHTDRKNVSESLSIMLVAGKYSGGYFCLPEFGVKIKLSSSDFVVFCGSKYVHGVSPIISGNRITTVFYAVNDMKFCLPISDEIEFFNKTRVKTEIERANKGFIGVYIKKAKCKIKK